MYTRRRRQRWNVAKRGRSRGKEREQCPATLARRRRRRRHRRRHSRVVDPGLAHKRVTPARLVLSNKRVAVNQT